MRKLFFKDKPAHQQELDVIAHGIVFDINGSGLASLKDYACIHLNPYDMVVEREWRSVDEVDIFEAESGWYEEYLWDELKLKLEHHDRLQ